MIKKLLWSKQNTGQLWMAIIGMIIGLLLLLLAFQTYFDIEELLEKEEENFVAINKKVGLLNLIGGTSVFDEKDLKNVEAQPFIQQIAPFNSSQFQVLAVVPSIGFRSEFFFESVPNDFLDVQPSDFRWSQGRRRIPIIISRDYLSLYNFGFAPTRGMPPLTQSTIKKVAFQIKITGQNGIIDNYSGKVVGFSDRINSILVPNEFLEWANKTYSRKATLPAKIMVKVDNPYSQPFKEFIKKNNYEVSSGRLIGDKIGNTINITIGIIAIIGFMVLFLALLVFLLNFKLLISKASDDIQLLLQIGYLPKNISQILIRRLSLMIVFTTITALGILGVTRYMGIQWLQEQGFELSLNFNYYTYVLSIIVILLLFFVNVFILRRNVIRLF
ncbi:MAG: FtsX-like permease family protein [Saprospiraceae bacterium]